jgi:hypothetical protein
VRPSSSTPTPGEVVWCDDAGVTCRRWNWRQARRTQLTDGTTAALFILDALDPLTDKALAAAADDLLAHPASARPGRAGRPAPDRAAVTSTPSAGTGVVPPWTLAGGAMLSVQFGSALSVPLIEEVGAAGTAWLRRSLGGLFFVAVARPAWRSIRRQDLPALVGLGVVSGLVTICFLAASARIPLGTAVAIEFLGPLTVAAVRAHSLRALLWPGLALAGVVGLTEPWDGEVDAAGLVFAGLGAVGWARSSCSPSASGTGTPACCPRSPSPCRSPRSLRLSPASRRPPGTLASRSC